MNYFEGIVGQEKNKKLLSFYIDYYKKFKLLPPFLFVAAKGNGKTMLATKLSEHLYNESNGAKNFAPPINASNLRNFDTFWSSVVLPYVDSSREYTILIDEASELPRDVMFSLLTALQPNDDNRNIVTHPDGVQVTFDFKKTTFLFATTDPQKLTSAMKSRLTIVSLECYNSIQLQQIIKNKLNQLKINPKEDALEKIVGYIKNNGRSAVNVSKNIISYCQLKNCFDFTTDVCEEVIELHDLKPYGLDKNDLTILNALNSKSHLKLMDLEAITGLEGPAIRLEFESNLVRNGLMGREAKGRYITNKGKKYLEKHGA